MTPHQIAEARKLRRRGISDATIGAGMVPPVSRQAVHAALGPRQRTVRHRDPVQPGPSPAEFAAKLRAWRARRGISQSQAARLLRVVPATISFWETERNGCSLAASILLLIELLDKDTQ